MLRLRSGTHPDPRDGKTLLTPVIDIIWAGVLAVLEELAAFGRILHRRRAEVVVVGVADVVSMRRFHEPVSGSSVRGCASCG